MLPPASRGHLQGEAETQCLSKSSGFQIVDQGLLVGDEINPQVKISI